ncbi:MAG TPA: hydrogenase small subunit [Acidimicrobiia bacterium]|jgi:hydrogenase small subunit
MPAVLTAGETLYDELEAFGVTRRSFLTFCATMSGVLALPSVFTERIAQALEASEKPSLIWLEFQDCAGNTESFLRAHDPGVADIVLDLLSVDYHETIMAAAGARAEAAKQAAIQAGGHIVVVEGSVPVADGGVYCTIGGKTAMQLLEEAAVGAAAIINVGTCSSFGGIPAASPNPTGARGVPAVIKNVPIINLPGCPMNVDNLLGVVAHYLTFGALPATDEQGRPLFAYGQRIHDNCERRAHFDAGQFALEWGDEGHRKGWCLYKLGCKGPSTFHNCPTQRWNNGTNWPVGAGHGCVGCSEADFWDTMSPFYERLPKPPGFNVTTTADRIGLTIVGATAVGFGAHGVAKVIQHRRARNQEAVPPDDTEPEGGEEQ